LFWRSRHGPLLSLSGVGSGGENANADVRVRMGTENRGWVRIEAHETFGNELNEREEGSGGGRTA